jgi:glycine/D-amino acid oxidase-like deaminating enzyme
MIADVPQPYWFARATPPQELDAVVVGGGMVGASTAFWAARLGTRVVLLEGERVGAGATGRSNGFLLTGSLVPFVRMAARIGEERALAFWHLSRTNRELLARDAFATGRVRCEAVPGGSWRTARAGSPAEEEWEASVARLEGEGLGLVWRGRGEVAAATGSSALGGACHAPDDLGVDPVQLCAGLVEAAEADVRVGLRVRHLEPAGERVRVVWNGGSALARRVVVAVNAYVAPLVPALASKVRPLALQGLAAEAGGWRLPGLWAVAPDGFCLRQLPDGMLLAVGGGEPTDPASRGYLELPTASGQAELETSLRELFPAAGRATTRNRWAGTIALSEDGLPWLRDVPGMPAVAYACAFNGQGLSVGFAVGRRLAEWLRDGDPAALEVFRPVSQAAGR